jgi:hypothetical protein
MLKFLYKEVKYPLGRWHNCGQYFDIKYFEMKEEQKKRREEFLKNQIDPYEIYKKNDSQKKSF